MSEIKAEGVRRAVLKQLEALVGQTMADGQLLDQEVLGILVDFTLSLNREILLMLDDHNTIRRVCLGDVASVAFGDAKMEHTTLGLNRIRVIHTHPGGSPHLSSEDCSAAKAQRLQCMVAVGVSEDGPLRFGVGLPTVEEEELTYRYGVVDSLTQLNRLDLSGYAAAVNRELRRLPDAGFDTEDQTERALLIGLDTGTRQGGIDIDDSMEELARLWKSWPG